MNEEQLRNIAVSEIVVILLEGCPNKGALTGDHRTLLGSGFASADAADELPQFDRHGALAAARARSTIGLMA
jgi:hypothetical protein